jgi:1-acyl-sn-glycerol-3-phosphate acyltransferase
MNVFHSVLIERSARHFDCNPIAPMLDALDKGDSLVLFPEGTRGSGDTLLPFRPGIFHVARARPAVELVPVWIENACRVMPKGSRVPRPLSCSTTFGQPIRLQSCEPKKMFLHRLRTALSRLGDPSTHVGIS